MLRYQETLIKNREISGEREGNERWQIIKPFLPESGTVLDIGSNLGYFGIKITEAKPAVGVVSIESDPRIISIQRKVLASHNQKRVIAIQGQLDEQMAKSWADLCDWFDITLLLSIIHWFDDPAKVVASLSSMSGKIIVEVPDRDDIGACGQTQISLWGDDPVTWFEEVTKRPCRHLGRVTRHTSDSRSHMILIEGPIHRISTTPYADYDFAHPKGNEYLFDYDGTRLTFTRRGEVLPYLPGVNIVNLSKLGRLAWPSKRYWLDQGSALIKSTPSHSDPLPHNMLWTPSGLKFIDDQDLASNHPRAVVLSAYKQHIKNWRSRSNVNYLPGIPLWRKLTWYWPKTIARKVLPRRIFMALKTKFSL